MDGEMIRVAIAVAALTVIVGLMIAVTAPGSQGCQKAREHIGATTSRMCR